MGFAMPLKPPLQPANHRWTHLPTCMTSDTSQALQLIFNHHCALLLQQSLCFMRPAKLYNL